MRVDKSFLLTSLIFAITGMGLGLHMGLSGHHEQHVTHAHILLVGAVFSFIHAVTHRLWLKDVSASWAKLHFSIHTIGAIGMSAGLWLMFGRVLSEPQIGPILGLSGLLVLVGVLMSFFKLLRHFGTAGSS
jgi:hypothetical protein